MASRKSNKQRTTTAGTNTKVKTKAKAKAMAKTRPRAARPAPRTDSPARKGAAKGLALVSVAPSYTVDNIGRSLAWYRDVMGFAVGKRWEEKGELLGVELQAGPVVFMIGQDDWNKGRHRVKGAGFRIYCDTAQDVDQLADGIKARGGTLQQEPRDEEWGGRAFTVQDPDGFKITISKER